MTRHSAFGGFDAMLPENGGPPVFLGFNTRPTQTTHLGGLMGSDLWRAMACALDGRPYQGVFGRTSGKTVALFPAELACDADSRRLTAAILNITPQLTSA